MVRPAFVEPTDAESAAAAARRLALREAHRVATTLGFGPRYLHSTGQLHKSGPDRCIFIQIVDDPGGIDLRIPRPQLHVPPAARGAGSRRPHVAAPPRPPRAQLPLSRLAELVS